MALGVKMRYAVHVFPAQFAETATPARLFLWLWNIDIRFFLLALYHFTRHFVTFSDLLFECPGLVIAGLACSLLSDHY